MAYVARGFVAALQGVGQSAELNHLAQELFADTARVNAVARMKMAISSMKLNPDDAARLVHQGESFNEQYS